MNNKNSRLPGQWVSGGRERGKAVNKEILTKETGNSLKLEIADRCGRTAADEVFEDAWFHGKNQVCQIIDENDHVVVVVDSECPDQVDHPLNTRQKSVIDALCRQGIVLYYYHSIHEKHHHVCLALKKKGGSTAGSLAGLV